jgi:hypothetical protein
VLHRVSLYMVYQSTQRKIPEDTNHRKHGYEKLSLAPLRMGLKKTILEVFDFWHFTLEEKASTLTGNFGNRLSSDVTSYSGRKESEFWNSIDAPSLCLSNITGMLTSYIAYGFNDIWYTV